jgi:type VI secretion system protein ImpA
MDIDALLNEVSAEEPCGKDLEYDPAFSELALAAQGKAEQFLGKEVVAAAEPPNWPKVRKLATGLLGRSKDLRIGVHLIEALLNLEGYAGLADGLAVLRGLLDRYWDKVHPQLDPEDGNDPTMRINILVTLVDREKILTVVRKTPLVRAHSAGIYSLHDISLAKGGDDAKGDRDEDSIPSLALIEAAFKEAELEDLQATAKAISNSIDDLAAIDGVLMAKVGAAQAPDLNALTVVLKEAQAQLTEHLEERGVAGDETVDDNAQEEQVIESVASVKPITGTINTREDAIKMMDKISNYFERHEPSSPVPLLMQRAKRLVSMNFMEILADIAPDGVKQAKNIGGVDKE